MLFVLWLFEMIFQVLLLLFRICKFKNDVTKFGLYYVIFVSVCIIFGSII